MEVRITRLRCHFDGEKPGAVSPRQVYGLFPAKLWFKSQAQPRERFVNSVAAAGHAAQSRCRFTV